MSKGSVKVMRSYDYCHFEVCLSSDEDMSLDQINNMRKDAARLTDEAVKQYVEAKKRLNSEWSFRKHQILAQADEVRKKEISDWTPEDKAIIKLISDKNWESQWDYDDDEPY